MPVLVVLVIDQITKQWVRTTPDLHHVNLIDGWLAFNFTKNPGMAMGMDWLSTPMISIVAIVATIAIITYILFTLKSANLSYLFCMGLILGGALGNITDRLFMAIIGGYGGVLDGHVVDFIHFNLEVWDTPVFPYIFNVADIAITTSIIAMLLFHKTIMPESDDDESDEETKQEATSVGQSVTDNSATKVSENDKEKEDLDLHSGSASTSAAPDRSPGQG